MKKIFLSLIVFLAAAGCFAEINTALGFSGCFNTWEGKKDNYESNASFSAPAAIIELEYKKNHIGFLNSLAVGIPLDNSKYVDISQITGKIVRFTENNKYLDNSIYISYTGSFSYWAELNTFNFFNVYPGVQFNYSKNDTDKILSIGPALGWNYIHCFNSLYLKAGFIASVTFPFDSYIQIDNNKYSINKYELSFIPSLLIGYKF